MGAFLTQPLTSKILERRGNKYFRVGSVSMQGWRDNMEDAHSIILKMDKHSNYGFFGVYDGHCGTAASKYCCQHLCNGIDDVENLEDQPELTKQIIKIDNTFMSDYFGDDGSTVIFTLIEIKETENGVNYKIISANIGDSRSVLGRNGTSISLSEDHKPNNSLEQKRIEEAGGHVSLNRVRGNLALSRAFGDRSYKVPVENPPDKQQVIVVPDYCVLRDVTSKDFLFIACDGIYEGDIFTRESVVEWITNKMKETEDLAMIMADLLDECLLRGSRDNMSAMLIQFKDGRDYDKEDEYIPGPYFEGQKHGKFQDAYQQFAEKGGLTVEESRKKYEEFENKKKSQTNGSSETTTPPL
jgi:protein phosphatase